MTESRIVIGDFLTGRNILDLSVLSDSWESRRNTADRLQCVVDLGDPAMRALDLRNTAGGGKTFLAKLIGDTVVAFGLITRPRYSRSARTVTLQAYGVEESYFRRRTVLPTAALTEPLIDPVTGEPNTLTNTVLSGWDLGTIMKKVIVQSTEWTGGDLPLVFEDDRVGTHEDTILGSSLTKVTTFLENYAARQNGPDWDFSPQLTVDRLGIELTFRTGTEDEPRLRSTTVHTWDFSVPEPSVEGFNADTDASALAGLSWTVGGRTTGEALVAFALNDSLTDAGFPLFESVDFDHDSVSDDATLLSYSNETVRTSGAPTELWSFRARTDAAPFPGQFGKGDWCDVILRDDDYIPDGTYRREIVALSGTQDPNWITVTTAEAPIG